MKGEKLNKNNKIIKETNDINKLSADILSHDLLGLASVLNNGSELLLEGETDSRKKALLELLRDSAWSLTDIIKSISRFAGLETTDDIEYDLLDLTKIIEDVIQIFQVEIQEKGISINCPADRKYPAYVNSIIKDVFMNLISNAIKYSPEGSEIDIGIREKSDTYIIHVKDSGVGIAEEAKKRVFERFERLGREDVTGCGLGLTIAERIVELHNGDIWVEDNPGGGSIFYTRLPINVQKFQQRR